MKSYLLLTLFSIATVCSATSAWAQGCHGSTSYATYPQSNQSRVTFTSSPIIHESVTTHYSYPTTTSSIIVKAKSAPKPINKLKVEKQAGLTGVRIPSSSNVRIWANFLGNQTGYVFLTIDSIVYKCGVTAWDDSKVMFDVPELGVLEPTAGRIEITLPNGRVAKKVDVTLIKRSDVEVFSERGAPAVEVNVTKSHLPTRIETGGITSGFTPPSSAQAQVVR